MTGSLTLLVTSPRTPAGILTRDAWRALEDADVVLAASTVEPTPAAIVGSGVTVEVPPIPSTPELGRELARRSLAEHVVWIVSPDGDRGLTDVLAGELTRQPESAPVEMLVGSWDQPGARLGDAVAVMDALRSPGGCPWDAQQTHRSLAKYLLEEAHETVDAIDSGDRDHLREELGDVLLQVLFHARIAADDAENPWDIDDVAGELVAKLVRRHPHVFGDGEALTPDEVEIAWEQIKAEEKAERGASQTPLLEGIPASLSTLLIADKVLARRERTGLVDVPTSDDPADAIGDRLLQLVAQARAQGVDADAQLRRAVKRIAQASTPTSGG